MCNFLNRSKDITVNDTGDLPHMHQEETMQYVTFHLADSLPQIKLQELREYLRTVEDQMECENIDEKTKILLRHKEEKINKYLDVGYGSCALADRQVRKLLVETFMTQNNKTCIIQSYVIMPNHVHMALTPLGGHTIFKIMKYIKGSSAVSINRYLGKQGQFWQREVFDRMIRNDDHLKHVIGYILNNPRHLPPSKFALYVRKGL